MTTPTPTPDDAGLRQRIADALAEHRNGVASDGQGWFRSDADRDECYALADVVLPLVAEARTAAHSAGRDAGLREGAAALQAVIDRDREAAPHQRGQSWIALGGARELLLDLLSQRAGAEDGQA